MEETAVREMEEELGLERSRVEVWAQMPTIPDRVFTFVTCLYLLYKLVCGDAVELGYTLYVLGFI